MILAALILLGVIMIVIAGLYQSFRAHVRRHGLLPVLYRWFSGRQHHGISKDNKHRYKAVYDPNQGGYEAKIRVHKALQRTGWTLGPPVALFTWLANVYLPGSTFAFRWDLFLVACVFMIVGEFVWRVTKIRVRFKNDKTVAKPLHKTLAPVVGVPLNAKPRQWINVSSDRNTVRALLPKNFHPGDGDRTKITNIIRETVGMADDSAVVWNLKDNSSWVEVKSQEPPPEKVSLADIVPAIEASTQDSVVLGLGRGNEVVRVSIAADSPHFGLSIAAGGGKSQLARLAAAQILHNGGIVMILDIKRLSHTWARDLPNVRYARSIKEIHDALLWLEHEINRRTQVADVGVDLEGEVHANVGPRILVIAEEMNEGMARLRRYWTDNRAKDEGKKSPAIEALEGALFMGRQVRINMFAVAQMMTALAAGSGAARENMGIRILGRYTRNAWKMLVPEHDMPPRSMKPGRVQVVTSKIQMCQVAYLTGAEARELASNGTVTPFPTWTSVPAVVSDPLPAIPVITGEIVKDDVKVVPTLETVTLAEAQRLCSGKTLAAIRKARDRSVAAMDGKFPESVGRRGNGPRAPHIYPKDGIMRWYENA
jgi:hypothetical protein